MKTVAFIGEVVPDALRSQSVAGRFEILHLSTASRLFEETSTTVPKAMVIADADDIDAVSMEILGSFAADPLFGHMPLIAVTKSMERLCGSGLARIIDDYIILPVEERDLLFRMELCLGRSLKTFELNPQTKLPGNLAIIKEIQRRIEAGEAFALAYADIDYFKPYNDRYGFSRGDEIIKMVGRVIANMVKAREPEHGFIGHIGGDDFVCIVSAERVEDICSEIIEGFDAIVPGFYDPEDRDRGYIESVSREGSKRRFPLLSLSIGVTRNESARFNDYLEMGERAAEMKKYAKTTEGSCFRVDRRQA